MVTDAGKVTRAPLKPHGCLCALGLRGSSDGRLLKNSTQLLLIFPLLSGKAVSDISLGAVMEKDNYPSPWNTSGDKSALLRHRYGSSSERILTQAPAGPATGKLVFIAFVRIRPKPQASQQHSALTLKLKEKTRGKAKDVGTKTFITS